MQSKTRQIHHVVPLHRQVIVIWKRYQGRARLERVRGPVSAESGSGGWRHDQARMAQTLHFPPTGELLSGAVLGHRAKGRAAERLLGRNHLAGAWPQRLSARCLPRPRRLSYPQTGSDPVRREAQADRHDSSRRRRHRAGTGRRWCRSSIVRGCRSFCAGRRATSSAGCGRNQRRSRPDVFFYRRPPPGWPTSKPSFCHSRTAGMMTRWIRSPNCWRGLKAGTDRWLCSGPTLPDERSGFAYHRGTRQVLSRPIRSSIGGGVSIKPRDPIVSERIPA